MCEFICNTSPLQYLHQLGLLDKALGFRLDARTRQDVLELAGEAS